MTLNPIYVLHGIWYDDETLEKDMFKNNSFFDETIKENIDCVHGNKTISQRFGRAYGTYKTDISPWVIGWVIGREIIPAEVIVTNQNNPDKTSYAGKNLKISSGTPAEVWVTLHLDNLSSTQCYKYSVSLK